MIKKVFGRYINIIKCIHNVSKNFIFLTIVSKLFALTNTYVVLYINKLIINELSSAVFLQKFNIISLINLLLICALIELVTLVLFNFLQFQIGKLKLTFDDNITVGLAESLSDLDMAYFDDPVSYNQIRQAGKCKSAILDSYNASLNFLFNIFSICISFVVVVKFDFLSAMLAIVSVIPTLIIRRKIGMKQYNIEKTIIKEQRFTEYLLAMFYNRNIEMEIQLYGFKNYITERIKNSQKITRDVRINQSLFAAKKEFLLAFFNKIFKVLQQLLIIATIIKQKLTIGDFSYYGGIINNLSASISDIASSLNTLHINNVKYDEYMRIISRKPQIFINGTKQINYTEDFTIEFDHVTFRYPHANQNTISDVCLKINAGEKIAFVGENGAGKTTLIKLLLRFYDPSEGRILLNGVDIKEYDLNSYRRLFSAMFQESSLYLLSIKENIILSNILISEKEAEKKAEKILEELSFNQIKGEKVDINRLYGREFDKNGYVFSKGQQQKIQSARMLFRDSFFYILDEPSSSIDVISEEVFLKTLIQYTKSKSVIYITHRYNNLNTMNKIFVLCNGEVIEQGDHHTLINKNGIYAKMFSMQNMNKTSL